MTAAKKLVDQKFNRLTVIQRVDNNKHGKAQWMCQCDCGNITTVTTGGLTSGRISSCGCSKAIAHNFKDLTGHKYGKLTVIKRAGIKQNGAKKNGTPNTRANWLCKCDCGKEATVCSKSLLNGNTTSCKCTHSENLSKRNWRGCGDLPQAYWLNVLHGAKIRNIEVNIYIKNAWHLFQSQRGKCALTGLPLVFKKNSKRLGIQEATASLDRIDSTKGYQIDNVQWVHKRIQKMKNNIPQDDFVKFCKLVASNTT